MRISDWSSDVCSSDLLARAGADVVIWGRREDRNEKAVAELRQFGGRVSARVVDVSEEREIVEGVAAAVEEMGRLDCVRSEEHTSELQSLMRISYAVFCLK